jgi:hypothetical protein
MSIVLLIKKFHAQLSFFLITHVPGTIVKKCVYQSMVFSVKIYVNELNLED